MPLYVTAVACPTPPTWNNHTTGTFTFTGHTFGAVTAFSCLPGYELITDPTIVDPQTAVCTAEGVWNRTEITPCQSKSSVALEHGYE